MYVVFDLDGVLLDSESDLSWLDRALAETLNAVGLENTSDNRALLFPPTSESIRSAAAAAGISPERLWTIRNRRYTDAKLAAIESETIRPYHDVDALYGLSPEYRLGILSNSPQVVVETFVERADLADVIEVAVGRGAELAVVGRLKPDPYLFEKLHERTDDDEYHYVGDEDTDRRFAHRTGMAYIHLDREEGPIRSLYDVRDELMEE